MQKSSSHLSVWVNCENSLIQWQWLVLYIIWTEPSRSISNKCSRIIWKIWSVFINSICILKVSYRTFQFFYIPFFRVCSVRHNTIYLFWSINESSLDVVLLFKDYLAKKTDKYELPDTHETLFTVFDNCSAFVFKRVLLFSFKSHFYSSG